MAMFAQLISPEQSRLEATVIENGGVETLRNNDKMLLELVQTSSMTPGAEGRWALRAKASGANPSVEELRTDIFEDPDTAVEKNQAVYLRKFEAQKHQIIDELTIVIQRESDRVIDEMKTVSHWEGDRVIEELTLVGHQEGDRVIKGIKKGPHNRIRDRVCASTL